MIKIQIVTNEMGLRICICNTLPGDTHALLHSTMLCVAEASLSHSCSVEGVNFLSVGGIHGSLWKALL